MILIFHKPKHMYHAYNSCSAYVWWVWLKSKAMVPWYFTWCGSELKSQLEEQGLIPSTHGSICCVTSYWVIILIGDCKSYAPYNAWQLVYACVLLSTQFCSPDTNLGFCVHSSHRWHKCWCWNANIHATGRANVCLHICTSMLKEMENERDVTA